MNTQQNTDDMMYYHTMVSKGARMQKARLEKINEDDLVLLVDIMKLAPPTKDDSDDLVSAFKKLNIIKPVKAAKTTCPPKRRLDENGNIPTGMEQGRSSCHVKSKSKRVIQKKPLKKQ